MKKTEYKSSVEKIVRDELKNTRKKVRSYIESALLSIIGLEKRYSNKYEIDHCNSRNSVLIDAFQKIAKDEAEKLAKTYKPTNEDIASFKEAFATEYRRQVKYQLDDIAKQRAQKYLEEQFSKVKIDVDKILKEEIGEPQNDLPF